MTDLLHPFLPFPFPCVGRLTEVTRPIVTWPTLTGIEKLSSQRTWKTAESLRRSASGNWHEFSRKFFPRFGSKVTRFTRLSPHSGVRTMLMQCKEHIRSCQLSETGQERSLTGGWRKQVYWRSCKAYSTVLFFHCQLEVMVNVFWLWKAPLRIIIFIQNFLIAVRLFVNPLEFRHPVIEGRERGKLLFKSRRVITGIVII